jgi:uncharacterized protein (DUF111 family)
MRSIPAALHLPDCVVTFERVMRGALAALQAKVSTPRSEAHRHVPELLEIIDRAEISDRVKQQAQAVMRRLAEAEARIHHSPIESVHLHEVGGDDALIDIVGVLAARVITTALEGLLGLAGWRISRQGAPHSGPA